MTSQCATLFHALEGICERPKPFQFYTARELWTEEHTSSRMLAFHLDGVSDMASRNTGFIHRSAEWIAAEFDIGRDTRIADFGCGPGLYASRLAKHGARVTGIDFSKRSIEYAREMARREQLDIQYVNADYLEYETEARFDLLVMIMCDFCALSPTQRHGMLRKFHRFLKPGGAVLLDVYSLSAFAGREEVARYEVNLMDGFWSPTRYHGFLNTFKYPDENVVLDKYTLVDEARTRTIYNWLQYFTPEAIAREFYEAGLPISARYSDVAGKPFDRNSLEFAVVGRRP